MPPGNRKIVAAISARGAPIHYQTAGPLKWTFADWTAAMKAARRYNATAIELWPEFGGFTTLTTTQMRTLSILFNRRD